VSFPSRFNPQFRNQLMEAMKRQAGFLATEIAYDDKIYETNLGSVILLEVVSGQSAFRLIRENSLDINLIHCSPSTGTRISTVNIGVLKPILHFRFFFLWSPELLQLSIEGIGGKYLKAQAFTVPEYQLKVGSDGAIYQLGDKGVKVSNVMMMAGGKKVLESSAIESWDETIEAIKILQTGTSTEGYVFESLLSNQLISILCSSFEIYAKRRFLELVSEGIVPNYSDIEKAFFSKWERDNGVFKNYEEQARLKGHSIAHEIIEKRKIDFGNYPDCKDAFSKAYGLKFPDDLGVDGGVINTVIKFIEYRHRIIHASPMLGMLNIEEVPPKEPVFPTKALVDTGLKSFDFFIRGLHKATQKLAYAKEDKT